jgi:hypothetical protein
MKKKRRDRGTRESYRQSRGERRTYVRARKKKGAKKRNRMMEDRIENQMKVRKMQMIGKQGWMEWCSKREAYGGSSTRK